MNSNYFKIYTLYLIPLNDLDWIYCFRLVLLVEQDLEKVLCFKPCSERQKSATTKDLEEEDERVVIKLEGTNLVTSPSTGSTFKS